MAVYKDKYNAPARLLPTKEVHVLDMTGRVYRSNMTEVTDSFSMDEVHMANMTGQLA